MSNPIIKIDQISKKYTLGTKEPYYSLRDSLTGFFKPRKPKESFWALKDVSFEVERGETIGIIGRNGAGKSTLLKILSRITPPTRGTITMKGRVASLLEVGTGFSPELSGRENIYLNGAILGMSKKEIDRKFDEIVAFAEIDKFLDTPVKRYSSGMYVRLAFAVAAHLEPEILIVDEVLAVGDAQFQKKCLGKMGDVAKGGRTVLFVSHNMAAVEKLCNQSIFLQAGRLVSHGETSEVIEQYMSNGEVDSVTWKTEKEKNTDAYFTKVTLTDEHDHELKTITTASNVKIVAEFVSKKPLTNLQLRMAFQDDMGEIIFVSCLQDSHLDVVNKIGTFKAAARLPNGILMPRKYSIKVFLWNSPEGLIDQVDNISFFAEEVQSFFNSIPLARKGMIALKCDWELEKIS